MSVLVTAVFALLMLAAMVWDLRTRRIPNRLTVAGLLAALALRALLGPAMLVDGLAGAGLALLLVVPLFALGAFGGGDVKLLVVVGAFTGPSGFVVALLASAIAGGVLGIAEMVRRKVYLVVLLNLRGLLVYILTLGRSGERVTMESPGALKVPYGAAIAVGSLAAWFLPLKEWWLG